MCYGVHEGLGTRIQVSAPNLTGANLQGANLSGIKIYHGKLLGARLNGADLSYASGFMNVFDYANLSGAKLQDANLAATSFNEADLSQIKADHANFEGSEFRHANLTGAVLSSTNMQYVTLDNCDLSDANLSWADLTGIKAGMWIGRVDTYLPSLFIRADLSHADLTDGQFPGSTFLEANFDSAKLAGVNFEEAILCDLLPATPESISPDLVMAETCGFDLYTFWQKAMP